MSATCRYCHSTIWWVTTAAHARPMPLDPDPTPTGNVTLNPDGRAVVHPAGQLSLDADAEVYMPHHATCPEWPANKGAADAG